MALYVHDDNIMLQRLQLALDTFCCTTSAKIKWLKSVGFLIDLGATSQWGIHLGFKLIPRGQTFRYLGFQVGLDITPT